jgi:DNA-directed RNA polymerase subunit beta'
MKRYRQVKLFDEEQPDLDLYMQDILEKRKLEKVAEPAEEDYTTEEPEE